MTTLNQKTKFKETEIGFIPEEWEVKELGCLVKLKHGYAFEGQYFSDIETPHILLTPGNFKIGGGFNYNKYKYYAGNIPEDYILTPFDLIITMTDLSPGGATLGYSALVPDDQRIYLHNQRIGLVEIHSKLIEKNFLYWWLRSNIYRNQILGTATGTTVRHTSPGRIEDTLVALPCENEQKAIAEILSSLDEKIELNRRMNKTLEEMGKALFKRWFVDFEFPNEDGKPYKSSGGKMVDSELGEIPELATTFILSQNIDTISGDWGKDHSSGKFTEEVLCIRGTDLPELAMGNYGKPPTRFIKPNPEKILQIGDIIIEISGGSTNQSTGRVLLITKQLLQRYNAPLICSNFCKILRPKKSLLSSIFYTYLSFLYNNDHFFQYENGTTGIKNLNLDIFLESTYLVIPSEKELLNLANLLEFYESIIQKNGQECFFLRSIRDSLLPKLISGRIRTTK